MNISNKKIKYVILGAVILMVFSVIFIITTNTSIFTNENQDASQRNSNLTSSSTTSSALSSSNHSNESTNTLNKDNNTNASAFTTAPTNTNQLSNSNSTTTSTSVVQEDTKTILNNTITAIFNENSGAIPKAEDIPTQYQDRFSNYAYRLAIGQNIHSDIFEGSQRSNCNITQIELLSNSSNITTYKINYTYHYFVPEGHDVLTKNPYSGDSSATAIIRLNQQQQLIDWREN